MDYNTVMHYSRVYNAPGCTTACAASYLRLRVSAVVAAHLAVGRRVRRRNSDGRAERSRVRGEAHEPPGTVPRVCLTTLNSDTLKLTE